MTSVDRVTQPSITPNTSEATGNPRNGTVEAPQSSFADALSKAMKPLAMAGTESDSHHIPLPGMVGARSDFQERALGIFAYRQQLIASNIANADTPGYKAVDIDVPQAMRKALSATASPLSLQRTDFGHIPGRASQAYQGLSIKYHVPSQPSVDGNTVEMDVERAKFAENAVMYEFSLDRVKGHYKKLLELLANLK